jgi:MYXO-CTERM domain-containing protein
VVAVAALAAACGGAGDLTRVEQEIVVGTEDPGDPAVVMYIGEHAGCSGTLVAPRVVVTASHCLASQPVVGAKIYFGADRASAKAIDVLYSRRHPQYGATQVLNRWLNDIALILLAEDAPAEAQPLPVLPPELSAALQEGAGGRIVGYGVADTGGFGKKHQGTVLISSVSRERFGTSPNPSLTCSGDSGGPLFLAVDGTEYLAGVTSTGDQGCQSEGNFARTDIYLRNFIEPFIASVAPGAAALGARCHYADHCASGGTCIESLGAPLVRYCSKACTAASDCPAGMGCLLGPDGARMCRYPRALPDVLGNYCRNESDCETRTCLGVASTTTRFCAVACNPAESPACPTGFACRPSADRPTVTACFPLTAASGPPRAASGGCAVGSGAGSSAAWSVAALALLAALRRRRRAA